MTTLNTVAFDIETTGFEIEDRLTVVGFDSEVGSRVFLNTGEEPSPPELEHHLNDTVSAPVTLSTHEMENALLDAVVTFVDSTIAQRDIKLVAFNGETWNGGLCNCYRI